MLAAVLAGCNLPTAQPDPTRFYPLSAPGSVPAGAATEGGRGATLGLCRIELPAYLRSPAVVLRPGGTGGGAGARCALGGIAGAGDGASAARDAAGAAGVRAVVAYPAPQAVLPEYEITVRVGSEGVVGLEGRRARFAAVWESPGDGSRCWHSPWPRALSAPADWTEGDYAALTARLGEVVACSVANCGGFAEVGGARPGPGSPTQETRKGGPTEIFGRPIIPLAKPARSSGVLTGLEVCAPRRSSPIADACRSIPSSKLTFHGAKTWQSKLLSMVSAASAASCSALVEQGLLGTTFDVVAVGDIVRPTT